MRRPVLCFVALLAACSAGYTERATQAVFDPAGDFWGLPFPSDHRRASDGTVDLLRWPGRWRPNALVEMWLGASKERLRDGWGVTGGVFFTVTGELDPASLPSREASMTADASAYLVDVDPSSPERGRRLPLDVEYRAKGDLYAPDRVLSLMPVFGHVRRPGTLYAAVLTDALKDTSGAPLGRSEAFHELFEGDDARLAPLSAFLEEQGLDRERVVCAAVFKTFDHNALLRRLAAFAESRPAPTLSSSIAVGARHQSFQVLTTRYEVPVIQNGFRPYANIGEGRLQFGADGQPLVSGTQAVDLVLTIPTSPMPAAGFPLTFYAHGSGGNRWEAANRGPREERDDAPDPAPGTGPAEWLARRGVATLGFDFPLHGSRNDPPDTTGLVFYNLFGNLEATIDNFHVAVMELVLLSRLAGNIRIDPTIAGLDAGGAAEIRFDPARLTAMGQSMGTTLSVPWATVDPRVKGFMFSGAGGMLIEIANTATEPTYLKPVLESFTGLSEGGSELHLAHPLLHAFQNVWDLVDPVAKGPFVSKTPHEGLAPRQVMMSAGFRDGYFHPRSEAALATSLGALQVGETVEPILPAVLALDGRAPVSYPLRANLNGATVGVVAFSAMNEKGHYVVFNQEGARHQYTCYLASVGAEPAKIAAPAALDAPCE